MIRGTILLAVVVAIIVALMLVAGLAPVVEYSFSVSNPGFPYTFSGYETCSAKFGHAINSTNARAWNECLAQYLIPPVNLTGHGSLLFSLTGLGIGPFPSVLTVGEDEGHGEFYALLHMSGSRILAAEQVPRMDVVYDQPGISIQNTSLSEGFLGNTNVTISISNQSGQTLVNPWVQLSIPGDDGNFTDKNGIKWMFNYPSASAEAVFAHCEVNGAPNNLSSGATCSATLNPIITALPRTPFRYSAEVRGYLGSKYSVTKQTFSYSLPARTVDQLWVKTFIDLVNSARTEPALSESSTLDAFTSLRFHTAVTQPDISDFGLFGDETSFFGSGTKTAIVELLLFPTTEDPYSFAATLQGSAPGHWAALVNGNYTRFGYFVGTGPYVGVKPLCPVTEITQAGINITQFFMNSGCSVARIPATTWLVVILSA